jgi:hypothetical protein
MPIFSIKYSSRGKKILAYDRFSLVLLENDTVSCCLSNPDIELLYLLLCP